MSARLRRRTRLRFSRVYVPVLCIVAWQMLYGWLGPPAMASPGETLRVLLAGWPGMLGDVALTVGSLIAAFVMAACFGSAVGFGIGLSPVSYRTLLPLIVVIDAAPKIVLYPVFLLLFGLTTQGQICFAAVGGFFTFAIIVAAGTHGVAPAYHKVGRVYRLSFWSQVRYIYGPAIAPDLVVASRMGVGICFVGVIVAEMFGSTAGLGFRLMQVTTSLETSRILAIVLLVIMIAFSGTFGLLKWQETWETKLGRRIGPGQGTG